MKILIIEDDKSLATGMKLAFKKLNMQSDIAYSAEEAKDFFTTYTYDIILLDVILPDGSGFDVLKEIRDNKINTPVLILSGLSDSDAKINGLNQGADDYLTKPFDKNELIARVNAIIRRSKGYSSSIIQVGELEINLDNKQAFVGSTILPLTNKEYAILEILALKKGRPISKEHLLDQLYGGIEEPEPKIIDVFVCKLRNKIKKITKQNYISTLWGQGYVLNDAR
jgi:two-component system cell cycle response regulator CtrA